MGGDEDIPLSNGRNDSRSPPSGIVIWTHHSLNPLSNKTSLISATIQVSLRAASAILIPRNCHESISEYRLQAAQGSDRLKPGLQRYERVINFPRSIL